ncbi:MAG: porin [Gammaproteobacteria bacterium]|nr:porin [Gammaproteobacteria bacterium]
MKKNVKNFALSASAAAVLLAMAGSASAANWLMLQGTERTAQAPGTQVWGFIQPTYMQTKGTKLPAGPYTGQNSAFNSIAPDQNTNSSFNIMRAQVGVRGANMPLDPKINYFFLAEFGNNGITANGGGSARVTDASVTFNHLPGARVRVGQFKTPGSEESFQAIHVFDYVNFTAVTDQMVLERYVDSAAEPSLNGPVSAFRDVGVQVFDTFNAGGLEHAYAVMLGNGNGISRGDNDDNRELYLYWSTEKVFGGQGPRREGLKGYVWNQSGKRTIAQGEFDRKRSGVGMTYRKGADRFSAEYITADGMIFDGTAGGAVAGARNNANTTNATINTHPEGKAMGYYLDYGRLLTKKWEVGVRYDVLERMTNNATAERHFKTITLGTQYFFNPRTRMAFNYEMRSAEAPNLPSTAVPNQILDSMDDRISLQVTAIF